MPSSIETSGSPFGPDILKKFDDVSDREYEYNLRFAFVTLAAEAN